MIIKDYENMNDIDSNVVSETIKDRDSRRRDSCRRECFILMQGEQTKLLSTSFAFTKDAKDFGVKFFIVFM